MTEAGAAVAVAGASRAGAGASGARACGFVRAVPSSRPAFSLAELIVVCGVIAVLLSLLLPAASRARRSANSAVCKSNLRQCGLCLLAYANENHGRLYPRGWGSDKPRELRWPVYVFQPPVWNPPVMRCPDDLEPAEDHSYFLNDHLAQRHVVYGKAPGVPVDRVVWMGEKVSSCDDYYMEDAGTSARGNEFSTSVELYRHGAWLGSNYLFLDLHVGSEPPQAPPGGVDPWDVPGDATGAGGTQGPSDGDADDSGAD